MRATITGPLGESTTFDATFSSGGVQPRMPRAGTLEAIRVGGRESSPSQTAAAAPVPSRKAVSSAIRSIMTPERHPNHVALVREALDAVHESGHEKEPPAIFALEVLGLRRVCQAILEVEAVALVEHLEDQAVLRHVDLHLHVRIVAFAVAAQDGIRERFAQGDGNIEAALARGIGKLRALLFDDLDDPLDVADVAGNLELERDVHAPGSERKRLADRRHAALAGAFAQKVSSARSFVSEIWKSVSSLVSSKSVFRSSFRLARRSSPPCSRIFFDSETSTPRPELSM